ncbi:hypothetical protein CVD28_09755 [Bacillus sp. M6-12]|uniref:sugar-binding transcriptional regulator n=1 Tax=Bacillus sp. M6-12 TaxID=2054166 RepID=UPI000C78ECD2|nr:sugar-binding domain-containing protein [Bacillus sp. M6-12]PLS17962.1 hypothetical protein CVD28_09755 [Bacillus sp. M6-12]
MRWLLDIQQRLLPDFLNVMQKRYHILRYIRSMQPVGRRSLALSLNLTERTLRSEVEFLKEQNLIEVFSSGMRLSGEGEDILQKLEGIMREVMGIDIMEKKLRDALNLREIVIVPGNSDESPWVKSELGKAAAARMKREWQGKNIIAVTGGSTIAEVANMLTPVTNGQELLFVPARGGLGENVHNQANTIAAQMAHKTNASYKVLYVPDQVSDEAYQSFLKDPGIKEVFSLIKTANMVIHGIGDAIKMAERRKTSLENLKVIEEGQAVGEAFGYYFNENGEIVYKVRTVGIQLNDLRHINSVIAVAGGTSKAKAIRSYMKAAPASTILITDEAAAIELIKG